jgi:hypothetical protein
MSDFTVEDNHYTRLGLPLGAPVEEVIAAFELLSARGGDDPELMDQLVEARDTLSTPGPRSLHNQRIKWAAAGEWYRRRYPGGRSVEEHQRWTEFAREALEEEPSWFDRLRGIDEED